MRWIVQENLHNEIKFNDLIKALKATNTVHDVVKLLYFSHEIEPEVDTKGEPTFCFGTTSMKYASSFRNWKPGYIDENIDIQNALKYYGEQMLNSDAHIYTLKEAEALATIPTWETEWPLFHVRPVLDTKSFAGEVMNPFQFRTWAKRILDLGAENSFATLSGDDLIAISSVKDIVAEYRCVIVDGKFITGSRYRLHGKSNTRNIDFDNRVSHYAEKMAQQWSPTRAFAMDIAILDTPDTVDNADLRIIELGSINAVGLYDCNMRLFVDAINALEP